MVESVQSYEPPPGRAPRDWITFLLALVAAALPVWAHRAFLDGEAILYEGDAAQLQFPRYVTLCESLARGEFPLWQTLVYGGSPFHANPENPTLYPPTLLLAAFTTPVWTINLTAVVHLALAGLGAFLLVRRLGTRIELPPAVVPAGALIAATFFAFSHFTRRDHLNLVAYGAAHALIPWMILCADGLLNGERPRRSAGWLALVVAGLFFTGGLYVIPYAFLALGIWLGLLGLLGDGEARRRTLRYGGLAALAAGLMIAAKLLPYRDWLPTTNRAGTLSMAEALSTTLGTTTGADGATFTWDAAWRRVTSFLGGVWVLLPGLLALALVRQRVVRIVLGLTLLGFAISIGGWTWRFFYELVPPFDQIRSAVRAWTLVNAFFPIGVGLGAAWLLGRVPFLRERRLAAAALGVAIALLSIQPLTSNDSREELLWNPEQLSEVRERYPRWQYVAKRAQARWRAAHLDRDVPDGRNEQFATSLLGVETVAGYQGHVWPAQLERHLYGPPEARVDVDRRRRRLAALSVRWLVTTDPTVPPGRDPAETTPRGIEGSVVLDNDEARERFSMPAVVVGVLNDDRGVLAHRILDHPDFPLGRAAIVNLPWPLAGEGPRASDAELAALDVLLVSLPLSISADVLGPLRPELADGVEVFEMPVHLDESLRDAVIGEVVRAVHGRSGEARAVDLGFDRDGYGRALLHVMGVDTGAGRAARFAVLSETWSWYPGWEIEGLAEPPVLRLADGVATAFLLPADPPVSPLTATYRPSTFLPGLVVGALGLFLALTLLLWPAPAPAPEPPPEPEAPVLPELVREPIPYRGA